MLWMFAWASPHRGACKQTCCNKLKSVCKESEKQHDGDMLFLLLLLLLLLPQQQLLQQQEQQQQQQKGHMQQQQHVLT